MAAFGATPPGCHYVGGGDLWTEPDPPEWGDLTLWEKILQILGWW